VHAVEVPNTCDRPGIVGGEFLRSVEYPHLAH
jgi:hypothetical protein